MIVALASSRVLIPEVCRRLAAREHLTNQKMNVTNAAIEFLSISKDGRHTPRLLSLITPHHVCVFYVEGSGGGAQGVSKTVRQAPG